MARTTTLKTEPDAPAWGQNIHPCGWDIDCVLLGRAVAFGEIVPMTAAQLAELSEQGIFKASDEAAYTAQTQEG